MANHLSYSFKPIVGVALIASLLTSCTTSATQATEPATPSGNVESSVSEITAESSEEETVYTGLSVETAPHENPFGDFVLDRSYNSMAADILNGYALPEVMYGFDNPYSIIKLQEEVYDKTGFLNTDLTLSDVNYFQHNPFMVDYLDGGKMSFSEHIVRSDDPYMLEGARAVLSSLGLRFGIDEIPASYLMERFPRYYYDVIQFHYDARAIERGDLKIPDSMDGFYLRNASDADLRDYLIFYGCVNYNMYRLDCVYSNPYGVGCITQVRDAKTGKHVLVPSDSEAQAMQEDINSVPGLENISIYVPETPKEFYEYYGYYPDDILKIAGNLNTKDGFEAYINSLSSSEYNELYVTAIEKSLEK